MSHFNAILVGGPPHSGKSVLTYCLTQALRQQGIDHYVLRACPDGEGDWSNEATPDTVRLIRQKGSFTPTFVEHVANDLRRRHLPLLVDVGGKPQPDQEIIFAQCTHAILIAQDEAGLTTWRAIAQRNGLHVVAELISLLEGEAAIEADGGLLRARLTGLERHHRVSGPVFDALALRTATYLFEPPEMLRRRHLDDSPSELALDLQELARQLGITGDPILWQPEHLPALLAYLPDGVSLGVYGRAPNWIFGALAAYALPADFYHFDVRLGWVAPLKVQIGATLPPQPLDLSITSQADYHLLEVKTPGYYLDYAECDNLIAPQVPTDRGVVINGRMPYWLLTGIVAAYGQHPWVAVYQPPLGQRAVIVSSHVAAVQVGTCVPLGAAT